MLPCFGLYLYYPPNYLYAAGMTYEQPGHNTKIYERTDGPPGSIGVPVLVYVAGRATRRRGQPLIHGGWISRPVDLTYRGNSAA